MGFISSALGALWEGLKLVGGIFTRKNAPDMLANKNAKVDAAEETKATNDVGTANIDEIRKDLAE